MTRRGVLITAVMCWAVLCWAFLGASESHAITIVKQVHLDTSNNVVVQFDQAIAKNQIQIEYLRDIIQINLKDVSIYPAKILPVSGNEIKKIFAYQYTPNLVRLRMTVDGEAKKYEHKVKLVPQGKQLSIEVAPTAPPVHEDRIVVQSAKQQVRVTPAETDLLKQVVASAPVAEKPVERAPVERTTDKGRAVTKSAAPELPNLRKMITWLAIMTGGLVVLVYGVRRLRKSKINAGALLGKFGSPGFGLGGIWKNKWIEVVSTQHLGPKKSIAVVRVKGRLYLVGVSSESINLISEISDTDDLSIDESGIASPASQPTRVMGTGAVAAGAPGFAQFLNQASTAEQKVEVPVNVRERIRRQMEGRKPI